MGYSSFGIGPQGSVVHVEIAVVAGNEGRVEVSGRVLEFKAEFGELLLHLTDGLRTEVTNVEQVRLGTRNEFTHDVDAFTLEAVVGPDRQFQLLDRHREVFSERLVRGRGADLDPFGFDVEFACETEQFDEGLPGRGERVTRGHGLLRFDVDDELVEVGALLHTGRFHLVGDLKDRRVDRVDGHRSEEHTSELQSRGQLVCRLLLEKKKHTWLKTCQKMIIIKTASEI